MIQYFIFIIYIAIAGFLYFELTSYKTRKLFVKVTHSHFRPACIVNKKTKQIIWKNKSFINQFPYIAKNCNFSALNPNLCFNKLNIEENGRSWLLENFDLGETSGILFSPTEKIDPYIFLDLPFAIMILDKKNEIKEVNETFKELICLEPYQNKKISLQSIIDQASEPKDIIWQTKEGLQPIKTSVKYFQDKTIIFLENNLDNIKLKRRAQESQHLQILGQLTSSIIHDFKNLLTSICGFADSLSEELPNDPSLKSIQQNIDQAANLLNELLNFVKAKPVEEDIIEPKTTLPKIATIIKALLGSKIKLITEINTTGFIKMSDTQLERILFNMVLNSKDAMKNGGTFRINTKKEVFTSPYMYYQNKTLPPGEYYVIEVSDTGCGIPPEHTKKIFSQFFTTKEKGTGLGLMSSLSLAQHCGGGITFTSSSNGTTFFIILPFLKENKHAKTIKNTQAQNPTNQQKNRTIILVEDEEMIRNIVKKTFVQEGFKVIDFENGSDALLAIKQAQFDCLITDAVLPGVDGTELANAAYSVKPEAKIFLTSGYDLETLKANLTAKLEYIPKPFTAKSLKEAVLKHI